MKTFFRNFFSSPAAELPGLEVGTGRAESSISAYYKYQELNVSFLIRSNVRISTTYVHVKITS